ncbi:hypothetical protein SLEP1_g54123 [Rubroshorea leprosula]|uniref:DUF4220 domain-containing protein n=1 Tax=Rubroshorea leprosula TaxID=152421 RepID=A0AAV5MCD0_9ROSI|nr:hypothetical protein SLEP1_g54123 [Rubroshorea leprosula]
MVFLDAESIKKLWDTWNIRGLIMLSLLVQSFLVLFASMRKQKGGKWVAMIWVAYLLADWVATFTIGLILRTGSSDILVLWAPFLLLHLGGRDSITSYSLEDNELWLRHLLGLLLQVGSTIYFILQSFSQNKLWLPTLLVLLSGIIKYAERNYAFYLASFQRFGENWVEHFKKLGTADSGPDVLADDYLQPIFVDSDPKSILQAAAYLFGTIRRPLLGSFLSKSERAMGFAAFGSNNKDFFANDALLKMEIQLSLLYEALYTKLPVIVSKAGCVSRILNLSCILGALLSFSLMKKHYELEEFDAWLTYGLLIGALTLDFISIIFLVFSDWFVFANFNILRYFRNLGSRLEATVVKRRRWSNKIPQLNFITYSFKDYPNWLNSLAIFLPLRSFLKAIKVLRCLSSHNFGEDPQYWRRIFEDVVYVHRELREQLIQDFLGVEDGPGFSDALLSKHIATELSIQEENFQRSSSGSTDNDRKICKLIADYMLYFMMMEPATMTTVSNNWEKVFKDTYEHTWSILGRSSVSNEKDASRKILSANIDNHKREDLAASTLPKAQDLARKLKNGTYSWERLREEWVFLMCYAARRCRPNVHSQLQSKGGELLTFIWLCMANYSMKVYG